MIEPEPTRWRLPSPAVADEHGLVAVGADLEPGTLLAAYRGGLFPMPLGTRRIGWWSPDPRGILPLDGLHVSRSLSRSLSRFEVRLDTCFTDVMRRCGDPRRPHGWINDEFIAAYGRLHEMGWAHSIEVFRDEVLVGGLYGVRIKGLFAGESMFHADPPAGTDASKVAVAAAVQWLRETGGQLFDVQWTTDHLATLGVVDISRTDYLRRVAAATC
ncbi:MAG: leucyl/phenylalanyl-tRNA--protein transferase [Actinobacteria bacterium]|nr:leucyl/phenylalanyl-tRNA--protein transferase [Actinomycetota bacterium]MSW76736.1 leucyl/phenylalanyl-tRNA--protein transferase [Actinomycetota bacterium]MSX54546.1 leucyl/phenylalanyl-tRNA--protein transferase [Actinomycetota bacterium]MSX91975.1 leucyl/phenylalanyl-tRNA--protein transferase [Actinomycetota bacterium]MSZ82183.1 leucyl/phenylalanyl-tRNA--protein transferase [Actinomycetota bacterium]